MESVKKELLEFINEYPNAYGLVMDRGNKSHAPIKLLLSKLESVILDCLVNIPDGISMSSRSGIIEMIFSLLRYRGGRMMFPDLDSTLRSGKATQM